MKGCGGEREALPLVPLLLLGVKVQKIRGPVLEV